MKKPLSPTLIRLFCLLMFIVISSVVYLLIPNKTKIPPPLSELPSINTKQTNLPTQPPPPTEFKEDTAAKLTTATLKESAPELLSATLQTPERIYNLKFQPGTTLLEAMRQLTARSEQPFMFSGREYPSLGFFVEKINGKKNDPPNGKYWIYYINGQSAQTGISNYQIRQNDIIEWKYEESKF